MHSRGRAFSFGSRRKRGFENGRDMATWQTIRVANPFRRNISLRKHKKSLKSGGGSWFLDPTISWERAKKAKRRSRGKGLGKRRPKSKRVRGVFTIGNARRRNPNFITDAVAGRIADSVASRVGSMFSSPKRKRRKPAKRKRRNTPGIAHLALIGSNPKRRKRRKTTMAKARRARRRRGNSLRNRPRDSKGRLLKVRNARKKRSSRRRRNTALTNPRRRRRRNRVRVVTKIKYRTRRVNVARKRRKKSTSRRRSRRRNAAALKVANPRRRRRRSTSRKRRRNTVSRMSNPRRRRRSTRRRRRNAGGLSGIIGKVNLMQVAEVAGGVFVGDKLTNYLAPQITGMVGVTDPTISAVIKAGLGVVVAGFVWRFRPALGLGIAVGSANALLNQYVFGPLWGMVPGLPSGMAGLSDYQARNWKMDDWLAGAGGAGVAGMGANKLLSKGL